MADSEERESILELLDNNHNIESYIGDILEETDTFYIIEKQFWDNWCLNVAFYDDKNMNVKKE